jgi:acetyl/propionyl-CoA carboxylase alpha subunit
MTPFPAYTPAAAVRSNGAGGKRLVRVVEELREISLDDDSLPEGEAVTIEERLIVAPVWGRLRGDRLAAGQTVEKGTVIGLICERGKEMPLICHARATFVAWIAHEGERVRPGTAVARLRAAES